MLTLQRRRLGRYHKLMLLNINVRISCPSRHPQGKPNVLANIFQVEEEFLGDMSKSPRSCCHTHHPQGKRGRYKFTLFQDEKEFLGDVMGAEKHLSLRRHSSQTIPKISKHFGNQIQQNYGFQLKFLGSTEKIERQA